MISHCQLGSYHFPIPLFNPWPFASHPTMLTIESIFPKLVSFLTVNGPGVAFEKYQASAYQLANILNFALQFDLTKMSNPSIQNDFSYYRRTVSKMRIGNVQAFTHIYSRLKER